MTKTQKQRGPGRPANFPNVETVAFLTKIPASTKAMVEKLAERREETIGVTLDRMIRTAFTDASRSRGTKAKANAPAAS